ncbi:uncharacterized protein L201_002410 [Kwoniella dendrophila CBS 6074]|uniref:AB hydrolase-1 domain-containing protein n=1 Tax=Kwoniella dendrophila CBS 6074 TaxID=1295534 RepID=A0AAX4JQ37_9TREE
MSQVAYHKVKVDDIHIFYREAGSTSLPNLLLLHGHASGSYTFKNLIPSLKNSFHIIASDYPGFGESDIPPRSTYEYTFKNISSTINKLTEILKLNTFAIYMFDYGAPIGFHIASRHPERINGIVSQNANLYEEGLGSGFDLTKEYWIEPNNLEKRNALKDSLTPKSIKWTYTIGIPESQLNRIGPDSAILDIHYLSRLNSAKQNEALEIQLDLLLGYKNNVELYPEWQRYLRENKPKLVGIWGKNDPFFLPQGAIAYKKDQPEANIILVDGGHFLNEQIPEQVAEVVKKLL